MPFINLKTTARLTQETCESLKSAFGKAIEAFPGKSEQWLMVSIEDDRNLWFRGDNSADTAVIDVDLFGSVQPEAAEKMTAALCAIMERETGLSPDRLYVRYSGFSQWGWNGSNF